MYGPGIAPFQRCHWWFKWRPLYANSFLRFVGVAVLAWIVVVFADVSVAAEKKADLTIREAGGVAYRLTLFDDGTFAGVKSEAPMSTPWDLGLFKSWSREQIRGRWRLEDNGGTSKLCLGEDPDYCLTTGPRSTERTILLSGSEGRVRGTLEPLSP